MKIKPQEFYSSVQAKDLINVVNRQAVVKHIKDGSLRALVVGGSDTGSRYAIKGEWLISFNERRKKGLIPSKRYTIAELKEVLQGAVDYCKQRGITTVKELIKSITKLDK